MLRSLPARKPPGRPRKKTKCLARDGPRKSQYSIDALIKRLVDKPASVINWSILQVWATTVEDGEETELNFVGKIKPPFTRGGKRYWKVEYDDREEVDTLGVEGLAMAINYSFRMGHNIV
ncbi:hypothetical protein PHYSODRAFT_483859, partial [Phytophthora sojae]